MKQTKLLLFLCITTVFLISKLSVNLTLLFAQNEMELMAELEGEHSASEFGFWSTALDFNGDGFDDLVVSANAWDPDYPGWPEDPANRGKFYFYFGKEEGFADTVDIVLTHWEQEQKSIKYLENLGDMNGDGYDDLGYRAICGVPYCDTAFCDVNILFGSSDPDIIPDQTFTFIAGDWGFHRQHRICWMGDINGDGFDDAGLIADDMEDYNNNLIIYGGSFALTYFNKFPDHNFVPFIYGAGDTNNDGFGDFIIGHKENDLVVNELYYGGTIVDTIPDIVLTDHINHPILNTCGGFYCGDWNGDGIDDFIGNCCSHYTEGLGVWYGSNPQLLGPQIMVEFYSWLPQRNYDCGDLNGDGKNDIVAGYHGSSGIVYCFLGCQNGTYDLRIQGSQMSYVGNLGWSVSVGDFNGDGYDDIAAGAPDLNNTWQMGKVFIFAGNENLEEADPDVEATEEIVEIQTMNFELNNHPNPFNPSTTITFETTNLHEDARIEIYNIKGQHIREFNTYNLESKINSVVWDGKDSSGNPVCSGIYLYKLTSGNQIQIKKAILVK